MEGIGPWCDRASNASARSSGTIAKACTGRSKFLRFTKSLDHAPPVSRWPCTRSCTASDSTMPPGSANSCSRAATLMPSP